MKTIINNNIQKRVCQFSTACGRIDKILQQAIPGIRKLFVQEITPNFLYFFPSQDQGRFGKGNNMKLSKLTRASLLLAIFFALDKGLGILRQVIIGRQFGLSAELDAFNVANNIPDMLFMLISGGALAIALIPLLTEQITNNGRPAAWNLFSRIANLAFIVTAIIAVVVAVLADPIVKIFVAPGFSFEQQQVVITLMRLNLVATLVFSISGLVIAGLQANQHFLLPALAPLLYDIGQIFGALVLAPSGSTSIGPITIQGMGLGVTGLVYGVIIGAVLHLGIQIPGLIKYQFKWTPKIDIKSPEIKTVIQVLGPRVLTMFFIQMIFIARDNFASYLSEGAVTALTYGYLIQQVPETLIGTAIGTALLPTLAEFISTGEYEKFQKTIIRALRVMIGLTLPIAAVVGMGLQPFVQFIFGFAPADTSILVWTTRGYLVGLVGHCMLEIAARSFYARKRVWFPFAAAVLNLGVFFLFAGVLFKPWGSQGISLGDSLAFTSEAIILLSILAVQLHREQNIQLFKGEKDLWGTLLRGVLAALAGGGIAWMVMHFGGQFLPELVLGIAAMGLGMLIALPLIWKEVKVFLNL